jgi:glutamine phosphoribosylpyrophosphate amidotransferase
MCAIVGCYLEQPTSEQVETLKRLFVESQIRGKHQTGLAIKSADKVWSHTVDGSGELLVEKFDWRSLKSQSTLQLAGHCRYSTSDLRYPQPIQVFEDFALCHNGVVDQRPPAHWEEYGYPLTTANDSELLYQAAYAGNEPLVEFPEASMAVCEVHGKRGLRWYRNGKRPLYTVKVKNGYFICSTKDIAERSGLVGAERCQPGVVYSAEGQTKLKNVEELIP